MIVPGTSFACPGYVRISYCVSYDTIKNSLPSFKKLAEEVITFLHGHDEYLKAVRISEALFSEDVTSLTSEEVISSLKGVPSVNVALDSTIVDMLVDSKIVNSKREAREFVSAGAISINNKKITDLDYVVDKKDTIEGKVLIIKKGKKNYYLGMI